MGDLESRAASREAILNTSKHQQPDLAIAIEVCDSDKRQAGNSHGGRRGHVDGRNGVDILLGVLKQLVDLLAVEDAGLETELAEDTHLGCLKGSMR